MFKIGDKVQYVGPADEFPVEYFTPVNEAIVTELTGHYVTINNPAMEERFLNSFGLNLHQYLFQLIKEDVTPPSGSLRLNSGKTQVREVDPAFILGLGEVLTASRQKYDEGNWMKETKYSTPYESAMRHLMKFWAGEEIDEETGKHHLLHAATNLMFLHYHTSSGVGVDDRLFKKDKK